MLMLAEYVPTLADQFKGWVNWLFAPEKFVSLATIGLILMLVGYRRWTRPRFIIAITILFSAFYFGSMADTNFFKIITKPDNIPITMLIFFTGFVTWLAFRQAAINDERMEKGEPLLESGADDKVLVWPDLVYTELLCLVLCTVFLVVWAIVLKAPLEPPANPAAIPNPSKAPWYFLGLQELLVYFDPWIAGVLLPGLIIFGLMALPYIDKNPRGSGYYTLKERKFVISVYMFGWGIMWIVLIIVGTFLRGPGWSFYGPYEYWDPHRPVALLNVNLSDVVWILAPSKWTWLPWSPGLPDKPAMAGFVPAYIIRESPGILALGFYFVGLPVLLAKSAFRKIYQQLGMIRYVVFWILMSWMFLVPIKMILRWVFNFKYFLAITEWFFNV